VTKEIISELANLNHTHSEKVSSIQRNVSLLVQRNFFDFNIISLIETSFF